MKNDNESETKSESFIKMQWDISGWRYLIFLFYLLTSEDIGTGTQVKEEVCYKLHN